MYTYSHAQTFSKVTTNGFGCYNEYLLVASPCNKVRGEVMVEKLLFYSNYHDKDAVKTNPQITVASFLAKEEMEGTLIRWMSRAIGSQPMFPVLLNNFGGIPPHTIYIRIQQHHPFKQLAAALQPIDQYVSGNNCPPMQLVTNPHLTIARRLPPNIFERAMLDYSQKSFHASFEISELVLLRRQHQYDVFKQISSFRLLSN